jgi:dodecin
MAKNSVYRIIDVVGVSETSWEDAGRHAVETAAGSLHDLRSQVFLKSPPSMEC